MKTGLLLFLLLPVMCFSQKTYPYKNLVLEGGGVRGLAYAGALQVLEEKGILKNIENVAGSSAGAIAGLMVALNYNSHEIDSVLNKLKIADFNDGKFFVGKIRRIKKEYGVFKGDKIESWLSSLIAEKTGNENITFEGLHQLHLKDKTFKNFFCTGTNISGQKVEILSWKTWPKMKLKTAVHISSSIPFYFIPVAIDSEGNEVSLSDTLVSHNLFVDGGMLSNFPINIFDSTNDGSNPLMSQHVIYNAETLGLKLERGDQVANFEKNKTDIAPYDITNMKEYSSAVINLMMESLNRKSIDLANEKGRT
ncbi:MAG: patatin-like phospholipase family protein, partial [Ginsengibacter sp.]